MTVTPLSIRRQKALALADFSSGRGLEIGPLNQPLVTKNMVDVHYVDVFSAAHLRDHYALDPNVKVEDIPDIDFVLSTPDGLLSLSEAVQPGAPFAWVIASHVVEHVPDVISWLEQIAEIIDDGGLLLLVVPDRRFTFDILRPATTVGQMLHAHEVKDLRPSVRAVYDQLARERPEGLHYATFKLPDGVSFMHVVFETDNAGGILNASAAFQAFSNDIEARCGEAPAPTPLTLVGSYAFGG